MLIFLPSFCLLHSPFLSLFSIDVKDALEFLETQQARVEKAESALLEVTREILPLQNLSPSNLTTTEVAQVLRELQSIYEQQQKRLLDRIHRLGGRELDDYNKQDDSHAQNRNDNNTDGTNAPLVVVDPTLRPPFDNGNNSIQLQNGATISPSNQMGGTTVCPSTPSLLQSSTLLQDGKPRPFGLLTPFLVGRVLSNVPEEDDDEVVTAKEGTTTTNKTPTKTDIPSGSTQKPNRTHNHATTTTPPTPATPCFSSSTHAVLQQQKPQQDPQHPNPPSTGRKRQNAFAHLELMLQRDIHKVLQPSEEVRQSLVLLPNQRSDIAVEDDVSHDADESSDGGQGADSGDANSQDDSSFGDGASTTKDVLTVVPDEAELRPLEGEKEEQQQREIFSSSIVLGPETTTLEEDSVDDDSALYCPTIPADRDWAPRRRTQQPRLYRPSHVQFALDEENSETNHTLLTMEDTLDSDQEEEGEETLVRAQFDPIDENNSVVSGASAETPVLDRYRLAVDDNSPHGVVVVPNERRRNHGKQRPNKNQRGQEAGHSHLHSNEQKNRSTQGVTPTSIVPSNSTSSPISVRRPKFRKTPHPNKTTKALLRTAPTIDENAPLNVIDDDITPTANNCTTQTALWATPHAPSRSPLGSILSSGGSHPSISLLTSPASRPLALMTTQNQKRDSKSDVDRTKVSPPSSMLSASNSIVSPALRQPRTGGSQRLGIAPLQLQTSSSSIDQWFPVQIKNVSSLEYEGAPRIVKMQITLEQVQDAVRSINYALSLSPIRTSDVVELSEGDLRDILAPLSERQCKNVVMSLCHWRRLLLRRLSVADEKNKTKKNEMSFTVLSQPPQEAN